MGTSSSTEKRSVVCKSGNCTDILLPSYVCYIYDTRKPKEGLIDCKSHDTSDLDGSNRRFYYYACKECYASIPDVYKRKFIYVENYQEYYPL